jgi:hypothetical protein
MGTMPHRRSYAAACSQDVKHRRRNTIARAGNVAQGLAALPACPEVCFLSV